MSENEKKLSALDKVSSFEALQEFVVSLEKDRAQLRRDKEDAQQIKEHQEGDSDA